MQEVFHSGLGLPRFRPDRLADELAQARGPPEVVEVVNVGRITAHQKPTGGVCG